MHLTILNAENERPIDKCSVETWFEAVQYVEINKQKYSCSKVIILNKRSGDRCHWNITPDPRPLIINDKPFRPADYGLKDW